MTHIVNFKTKKALKEAARNNKEFFIEDPSIVNPRSFTSSEMKNGEAITVTNHPKRNWFAQLKRTGGSIVVR